VSIVDLGDGGARVKGPAYCLAPCDLADVGAVEKELESVGFDTE
jgi:hypothetical protein